MTAILTTPDVGVFRGMKLADYHALPVASNSRLRALKRSPAHLLAYLSQPPEDTKATLFGNAVHCVVLEPDDFDARYCMAGQCTATLASGKNKGEQCRNTGIGWRADTSWLCGTHSKELAFENTRIVIDADDYAACLGIRDSIYRLKTTCQLLASDDKEMTTVFPAFDTDILAKARFDCLSPVIAGGVIVDLKTTRDASRREFERSIYTYGYHRQAALYLDGAHACQLPAEHFVHIAIEKERPYAVAAYRLTEGAIDAGEQELLPLLTLYAECMESGVYPAYPDEVQDIALPPWAWSQIDAEIKERSE